MNHFIYLGQINGNQTVAEVSMVKPIPYVHTNGWDRTKADLLEYEQHLTTAPKYELIGNVPDGWVVGESVEVELQKQWLYISDPEHHNNDYWENCSDSGYELMSDRQRRIVAKPIVVVKCDINGVRYDEDYNGLPSPADNQCTCNFINNVVKGNGCPVHEVGELSAEEILSKHVGNYVDLNGMLLKTYILAAMEEYANQFKPKP